MYLKYIFWRAEGDENGTICSETTPLPITMQTDQGRKVASQRISKWTLFPVYFQPTQNVFLTATIHILPFVSF